eukprot:6245274-Karenia_brevis.AAC.1
MQGASGSAVGPVRGSDRRGSAESILRHLRDNRDFERARRGQPRQRIVPMATAPEKARPQSQPKESQPPFKVPPVSHEEWQRWRNSQGPPRPVEFKHPPSKSTTPTGPVIHTAAADLGNVTGPVIGSEGKSAAMD